MKQNAPHGAGRRDGSNEDYLLLPEPLDEEPLDSMPVEVCVVGELVLAPLRPVLLLPPPGVPAPDCAPWRLLRQVLNSSENFL